MAGSAPRRRVIRGASATVALVTTVAISAFLLIDAFARAGLVRGLLLAPWVLLVVWGVYVVAYASAVEAGAAGLRVRNALRITEVPWGSIEDIVLLWQLEVHLKDGGVVRAVGGPGGGRPGRAFRTDDHGRPARVADRDVEWLRDRWSDAVASGAPAGPVRRSWDVWALTVLGLLIAWALVAVLITGGPA